MSCDVRVLQDILSGRRVVATRMSVTLNELMRRSTLYAQLQSLADARAFF